MIYLQVVFLVRATKLIMPSCHERPEGDIVLCWLGYFPKYMRRPASTSTRKGCTVRMERGWFWVAK